LNNKKQEQEKRKIKKRNSGVEKSELETERG
jgi:hypothetical protein